MVSAVSGGPAEVRSDRSNSCWGSWGLPSGLVVHNCACTRAGQRCLIHFQDENGRKGHDWVFRFVFFGPGDEQTAEGTLTVLMES